MFKWLKKFIENLGSANQKSLGSGRLDCCDLSQKTTDIKKGGK